MARSLRGSVWEILTESVARGMALSVEKRDVIDDTRNKVSDFKTAISSWDNCMAANFCKWPVIAIIVVGGLIVLGIVICLARCLCCGVSCCCSCCQCFKCCGNCCGCCDPPGGPKQKYLDAPYNPEQGYKTQAPMHAPFPSHAPAPAHPSIHSHASVHPHAPAHTGLAAAPPQYAEFDMPRKGGEDALPAMPSWEESQNKKVLVHEEEVEMDQLKKPVPNESSMPLMAGPSSSIPTSPMPMEHPTGYGPPQGPGARGFATAQSEPTIPFTTVDDRHDLGFNGVPPPAVMGGMRSQSPAQSYRGYGPGPGPLNQSYNSLPSPGNGPMNQSYNSLPGPGPGNVYGSQGPYNNQGSRSASPDPYGMQRRGPLDRQSPLAGSGPYGASPRQSPAPQPGRGYGAPVYNAQRDNFNRAYSPGPGPDRQFGTSSPRPGPDRQYSNASARPGPDRQYGTSSPRPGPDRQYGTPSPRPLANMQQPAPERPYAQSPPASPITNNSGFDFNSGYARPQPYDRRPSESREAVGQEGYPGYKPYNKPQDGWSGI
jgi:hypothetical protein